MTTKQIQRAQAMRPDGHFPGFSPRDDMNNPIYLYAPGYLTTLHRHFGSLDSTLVLAEMPLGWHHRQREGILIPNLMIAFDVKVADVIARRGYSIEDQGKAPEFVLEVASPSTGRQDEERKRAGYQEYGVREYWRFDPSGGECHRQSLAGDTLADGTYRSTAIEEIHPRLLWGRSAVLGLSICWEYGHLCWWDPAEERYLETQDQTADARAAAEPRAKSERTARVAAEERAEAAEARVREIGDGTGTAPATLTDRNCQPA